MTSNDWSQNESVAANVATPDLFGGELFGDELMDMYNSEVVVGTNSDMSNGKETIDKYASPHK